MILFQALLALGFLTLAGFPAARRLDPEGAAVSIVGESFLLGCGVCASTLLFLDILNIQWSTTALAGGVLLLMIPFWLKKPSAKEPMSLSVQISSRPSIGTITIHGLTLCAVIANAWQSTRPELWDWTHWLITRRDYFCIWGFKGRLFFLEGGIPWRFLARLPDDFGHPDYPILLPLVYDAMAVVTGAWHEFMFGVLSAAFGAALLTVAHRCFRDECGATFAAVATLALSASALLPWPGFAEGPLVAFGGSAILLLRRRVSGFSSSIALGVIFLAMAAMTKNEGIALFVATVAALATFQSGRRLIPLLWPAALVIGAWFSLRLAMRLPTDVFAGAPLSRLAKNLPDFGKAFATVPTYQPLAWIGSLVALILDREGLRRERFLLTIVSLQLAFYLAIYAVTPLDISAHVNGSWDRITSHVTVLLVFAGLTSIGRILFSRSTKSFRPGESVGGQTGGVAPAVGA